MITNNILENISQLFCGDVIGCYTYKNGEKLVEFFNENFDYNDEYKSGFPTRWRYVKDKLLDLIDRQNINEFFNIILSLDYIKKEQSITEVEAAKKAIENYLEIQKILNSDSCKLVKTNSGYFFTETEKDLEEIKPGGFAIAYIHKPTGLVVKKLKREYLTDTAIQSRFKREFTITKGLSDIDGIITVYDFDENDYSYTMEKGDYTLEEYINKYEELTQNDRIKIIKRILTIMSNVHQKDVIHRDLSPNNIFAINRRLKIADFGLGKDLTAIHSHQTKYTNGYGQYYYCAPEQLRDLKTGDKRSDVYSLGRIINFVLTKDPENSQHCLRSIAEKATLNNPDKRFDNAQEMLAQFQRALDLMENQEYQKRIKEKIAAGQYDDDIDNYIYNMAADSISKFIMQKEKGFSDALLRFMRNNEEQVITVINNIEETYETVCGWTFIAYDPFADFAYRILKDESLIQAHVNAASILSYVAYKVGRFSAQQYIEELDNSDIDPIIQDVLHEY